MNFLQKITALFSKRPQPSNASKIVVLGNTGVGKTQFIHSLIDELRDVRVENSTLKSSPYNAFLLNSPIVLLDTAGEDKTNTSLLLSDMLGNKEVEGIINVVSYGYIGAKERVDKANMIDSETQEISPQFLALAQQKEIKHLESWISLLTAHTTVRWMVTVINQADVWYPKRAEIMHHYEADHEEYKTILRFKKNPCLHYTVQYSAILERYLDIFPVQIGITEQRQMQANLFNLLCDLVERD